MENIKELSSLVKGLFKMDSMHEEYIDNDLSFSIDSQKKDENTLVITVSLNKDKKNFENWVNELDDDVFNETWEALSESYGLKDLNEAYNGENYKEVIKAFKSEAKLIAQNKVNKLKKLFNL